MADRLQQLLRQRALLQEHLAWLDREIAEATDDSAPIVPAPVARAAQQPLVIPSSPAPAAQTIRPAPSATPYAASQAAKILSSAATPSAAPTESPAIEAVADEILEQYRVGPDAMKTDVKKGCLLYFFSALALLILGVLAFYYANHH